MKRSFPSTNGYVPKQPRILILSAAVGTGHLRAAEAVELALRRLYPQAYIRNVDVLIQNPFDGVRQLKDGKFA